MSEKEQVESPSRRLEEAKALIRRREGEIAEKDARYEVLLQVCKSFCGDVRCTLAESRAIGTDRILDERLKVGQMLALAKGLARIAGKMEEYLEGLA